MGKDMHTSVTARLLLAAGCTIGLLALEQSQSIKSDAAIAFVNQGTTLTERSGHDEAIVDFGRAIALKPDEEGVHNNLGAALEGKGIMTALSPRTARRLNLNPITLKPTTTSEVRLITRRLRVDL